MKILGDTNCDCAVCKNNMSFDMPNEVIESVKKKELILFCGAGISTESKAVLPSSFYIDILNFLNDNYNLNLDTNISFSKLMSEFCEIVPNGRKQLIRKIKERFDMIQSFPELYNSATRFHEEVACIPQINTIITTNWDDYFERKCGASSIVDNKDTALWNTFERRVFKIHGSINNIGSIVATSEDYEKCYERLEKEPVGDRLKTLLGSNCVVFIGFSFGDEDLNKIIDILSERLDEFANQYYLVTIDKSWENNVDPRIIPIITDGMFFIHSLKNILVKEQLLLNEDVYEFSHYASSEITAAHVEWVNNIEFQNNLRKCPEILLSVAYQDGMIHAYQHCYANEQKGTYLMPDYLQRYITSYSNLFEEHMLNERYTYAYYDLGYLNGLIGIQVFMETDSVLLPPIFVFDEEYFENDKLLIEYIENNRNNQMYNDCRDLVSKVFGETVPHFPPWYC